MVLLFLFLVFACMMATVFVVWIVIPLLIAMVIKLVNKIRRGSEDGIY